MAAQQLLTRLETRRSLLAWCKHALAPQGFTPARHHRLLIDELAKVASGATSRLMVLMPPGSAKSSFVSDLFPAWYLAQKKNQSLIGASNTADLAQSFSRRVRGRIRENSKLLGYALDREAEEFWTTTNGGQYRAAGVGGTITGLRADCLVAGTKIHTPYGFVPIEDIEVGTEAGYALSYDNGSCAYRKVVAILGRKASSIWRIRSASGRLVEATGNHRFWTGRGWTKASALVVGDVLLRSVPSAGREIGLRGQEESEQPVLLQQELLNHGDECLQGVPAEGVQKLREVASASSAGGQCQQHLLEGMQESVRRTSGNTAHPSAATSLRSVRDGVQAAVDGFGDGEVLFCSMQKSEPFPGYEGAQQSWVAAWFGQGSWRSEGSLRNQTPGLETGQDGLRGVQNQQELGNPSRQHDAYRSSVRELGCSLPRLSSAPPCSGSFQAEGDVVSVVERVCGDRDVWDIQVEGTECFFAGDILVHNCAIIDDPVKSREDADSETRRNRVWEWFQDDLTTRLKPGAGVVLVQTRWHADDLAGRLLETQRRNWKVLSLPALAEDVDDPLGRQLGEWLWDDDDYGYAADLKKKRAEATARTWSALYQQRPSPETGDYFRKEWLRPSPTMPPRDTMRVYGASDYAVTSNDGDYTVHVVVGMDPDGRLWLLDLWRQQSSSDVWIEALCDMVLQWKPIGWAEETGQIRAGIGPFLDRRMRERRAYVARQTFPTRGDKAIRAQSIRGRMALEGLMLPADAPWRADLETEMMSFPAGKHDDQVDALGLVGQLLDVMVKGPPPKSAAKPVDTWARAFARDTDDGDNWRAA